MSPSSCVTLQMLCLNLQEKASVMHYGSIEKGWLRPASSRQHAAVSHAACFTLPCDDANHSKVFACIAKAGSMSEPAMLIAYYAVNDCLICALLEMVYAVCLPSSLPQGGCVCNAGYCRQHHILQHVLHLSYGSSPGQAESSKPQQLESDEHGRLVKVTVRISG